MPELPDVTVYVEAVRERTRGHPIEKVRLGSVFLLRTAEPPVTAVEGRVVTEVRRIGKRVAIGVEGGCWLVLHLMIAGRLHWSALARTGKRPKTDGRRILASVDFPHGSLYLTEAGTQKRASLHMASGEDGLAALDPGGIDVLTCGLAEFSAMLTRENHTLKRALTDPHNFSGIGNAYSDEILHRACLSPILQTHRMTSEETGRLFDATRETLIDWVDRLRKEANGGFPEGVTAFREGMAVHGRFGQPCPRCGAKVQRIRYAANETNYCARCQTGGRVLADRALSRLLGKDWPRTLD
ncbi:MAG: formamidopyrimidine-DNA glycosylase [Acidobacteria bacterium]|nr:formamidopyrimidine-DNA glycosylase [Acidobacteriota bacterium]